MRVSVFGLGYVGSVTAACLARDGHSVIGVDANPGKVDALARGRSPVSEPGLDDLVSRAVEAGRLQASVDAGYAVNNSDISMICVGTPGLPNGGLDLRYVRRVAEEIGTALCRGGRRHTVVVRSTVLPGTTEEVIVPALLSTSAEAEIGVAVNPEFMREGSGVHDFDHPARTVIGTVGSYDGYVVAELYARVDAPVVRTDIRTAEMVKYVDNAFHALKIAFSNEIGNLCKLEGIDSHELMTLFCLDRKLNISTAYLRPGHAFGGSCLPKDLRALLDRCEARGLQSPVLQAALSSNELQKSRVVSLVAGLGKKKIGVLGLSFKAGTDDLRESPSLELVEVLLGKGYEVSVYDPTVSIELLVGSNMALLQQYSHVGRLMRETLDEVLEEVEVVVVTKKEPAFANVLERVTSNQTVVDLVRIADERVSSERYIGIAW